MTRDGSCEQSDQLNELLPKFKKTERYPSSAKRPANDLKAACYSFLIPRDHSGFCWWRSGRPPPRETVRRIYQTNNSSQVLHCSISFRHDLPCGRGWRRKGHHRACARCHRCLQCVQLGHGVRSGGTHSRRMEEVRVTGGSTGPQCRVQTGEERGGEKVMAVAASRLPLLATRGKKIWTQTDPGSANEINSSPTNKR